MAPNSGYSGTPLVVKLGYKPGMRLWLFAMPETVRAEIDLETAAIIDVADCAPPLDGAHIFVTERAALERHITALRSAIRPAGFIWVSWPKKASKLPTDITEDGIRAIVLPTGLVDVKVCAVDSTWSALKLVIRRELR